MSLSQRPPVGWRRPGFVVSSDPGRIDRPAVLAALRATYWAEALTAEALDRAIENSISFAVYEEGTGATVGFARVVSDLATFAWLADVVVFDGFRGRGLGHWMTACVLNHPDLQGLRRWQLATRDAHAMYRRFGFEDPPAGRILTRPGTLRAPDPLEVLDLPG
ncbi:GNAT family N-acetyltransferase [Thalassobaculum sp.]|uniref:GNAT family N-acetyltransferase n=1 Tax=Thalassobaculum sp. TaxID=2022740 RepID=UPI0032EF2CD5